MLRHATNALHDSKKIRRKSVSLFSVFSGEGRRRKRRGRVEERKVEVGIESGRGERERGRKGEGEYCRRIALILHRE